MPEVIVVQAGFRVEVLAWKAEGGIRGAVSRPGCRAPQGAAGAPGDLALFVSSGSPTSSGRGADQVKAIHLTPRASGDRNLAKSDFPKLCDMINVDIPCGRQLENRADNSTVNVET
jgi:hypothetical protein